MNAVEIEEAVSELAEAPFIPAEFPFLFLEAFGNPETTLKRLRQGNTNQSDVSGGILQRNNIHMKVCSEGSVSQTLEQLRTSPANAKNKVKFILATDGLTLEAENLVDGETVACAYKDFSDHFGFFLPLAGISTVKEIRENAFDIKATSRLNRLYVELLKDNPGLDKGESKEKLNHLMACLIFCFFAEDTSIFMRSLFTETIEQMTLGDASITNDVISELFRAMSTPIEGREKAGIRKWANRFPYVNGGLFSGNFEVPKFSKIARSYLLHVGKLDWRKINPDIFGSMIQAVAEDEERGALGMHYTSVPNILKVLNPLFLDDLRAQLNESGSNPRKLLNLRERISRVRIFDPACGSGNFLVIAYKELRSIEAEINERRGEITRPTAIKLTNFRGIEIRHFAAEIARLALTIAEYQCDVLYRGEQMALATFLPLKDDNWIVCGNALRLDWTEVCPPSSKDLSDALETYICGNPPYLGSTWQSKEQKNDLKLVFEKHTNGWKSLDYVSGWFLKSVDYGTKAKAATAFVSTNSICQGQQVSILWPLIFQTGHEISFAYTSFKWANLASHNAGVTVVIVGLSKNPGKDRRLNFVGDNGEIVSRTTNNINAYLVASCNVEVSKRSLGTSCKAEMIKGNQPTDGGYLLLSQVDAEAINLTVEQRKKFVRRIYGSAEFIRGLSRYCLWIDDADAIDALSSADVRERVEGVRQIRTNSPKLATVQFAKFPHRFTEIRQKGTETVIIVPSVSSESREYLPVGYCPPGTIVSNLAFALCDAPLWNLAIIASRIHLVWIATVCGKLKTDFRYSNTLGWNTFPLPPLTEQNKADLTRCAENILLARESHFPATIAELYDPETMPENLKMAHAQNDEVLERIYIGRRFKNDTERLEKLFELYTKMTAGKNSEKPKSRGSKK